MSEHWIRLRGGWTADRGDSNSPAGWLTLPLSRSPWPDPPRTLRRHFQAPLIDPQREAVWLVLAAMPGRREIRLNGEPLDATPGDSMAVEIPLPAPLPHRCRLEIELMADDPGPSADEWGHVALVIRPRSPGAGAAGEPGGGDL